MKEEVNNLSKAEALRKFMKIRPARYRSIQRNESSQAGFPKSARLTSADYLAEPVRHARAIDN